MDAQQAFGPGAFGGTTTHDKSVLPVLAAGAVTTAATVFLAVKLFDGVDVMGLHYFVFPLGAGALGLVATIGFGLVAWKGGHRITAQVLLAAGALLVAGYAAHEWLLFQARVAGFRVPDSVTFASWFDVTTRHLRLAGRRGNMGGSLEEWGYAQRALDLAGFILGGLAAPLVLRKKPYCNSCGRYRKNEDLGVIAAGIPDKVFGNNSPERTEQRAGELSRAHAALARIYAATARADGPGAAQALSEAGPWGKRAVANAANARIAVSVSHCPGCGEGQLHAMMVTGQGKQIKTTPLSVQDVSAGVAQELLATRKG